MTSYVTDGSGAKPDTACSSPNATSNPTGKGEPSPPRLLRLQSAADYTVDESFAVDTRDHEDHTFCGIMFDLIVKELLPVQYLEVDKIWVRGGLGDLTVWMIEGSHQKSFDKKEFVDADIPGQTRANPRACSPGAEESTVLACWPANWTVHTLDASG